MSIRVETEHGVLEGETRQGCATFLGIPFARPPIGELRFMPPQPPEPWAGVRSAREFGASAAQGTSQVLGMDAAGPKSEDCLYLNVFTPAADGKKRPVMFWIHGGAFTLGSASSPIYDGSRLALRGDVVVVTTNYRLGALGYLSLAKHGGERWGASANCGQLDQVAALRWVKNNIERFGGDPNMVTIFGESAGGMAVCTLLGMPAARGLFHRAVSQSGASLSVRNTDSAAGAADRILEKLGIKAADAEQLRSLPIDRLIEAQQQVTAELGLRAGLGPVVDGATLPHSLGALIAEGRVADVPLLIGTNRDEMNLFNAGFLRELDLPMADVEAARIIRKDSPEMSEARAVEMLAVYRGSREKRGLPSSTRAAVNAIQGDRLFRIPSLRFTEAFARLQPATYAYFFSYESPAMRGALRSCHALEIAFVFGTLDAPFQDRFAGTGPDVERLSVTMMDAWLSHAKGGAPSIGEPVWPRFDPSARATMVFDKHTRLEHAPFDEERLAWEGLTSFGFA
jgi:para-nitrobenzyl esterase